MIDKPTLVQAIMTKLELELSNAITAAETARLAATDDESAAETQYDTLGLEASYLAHGQSERAELIKQQILQYQKLVIKDFNEDDGIALGAIIELLNPNNLKTIYFIGPSAGGLKLCLREDEIFVITPQSPLAQQLIGKFQFDQINMPGHNQRAGTSSEIVAVY